MTRLNKYLADCGVCSRREADNLIEKGKVFVNGELAKMGVRVTEKDRIVVNGKLIKPKTSNVVLAFYKPVGVTCTEKDKHAEKIINDYINYPIRVTYAGRLDKDSQGLLLLTNDGKLIDAMMRGANGHEKEYVVKVNKELTKEFIENMSKGVYLDELEVKTRPCEVRQTGKFTFQIILTQGLNRQIRRMCKTFGYEVVQLKRIRIMNITLEKLHPGKFRELSKDEIETLYYMAGMK